MFFCQKLFLQKPLIWVREHRAFLMTGKTKARVWNHTTHVKIVCAWWPPAIPALKRQRQGISKPKKLAKTNQISELTVKLRIPMTPNINTIYIH